MDIDARLVYGVGVLALGLGNVLYGIAQLLEGQLSTLLSIIVLIMGVTMSAIGGLIVTDSDRISTPDLSDRVLVVVGIVALVTGLFLLLGTVQFFLGA